MNKTVLVLIAAVGIAGSAHATDLKGTIEAPDAAMKYNWTGFAIGLQAGYSIGEVSSRDRQHGTGAVDWLDQYDIKGGVIGLRGSYNYQVNSIVLGAVGDVNLSSTSGSVDSVYAGIIKTKIPFEASLRARIGVAFDNVFLYGTGGVVWSKIRNHYTEDTTTDSFHRTEIAGIYGAGVEVGLNEWTVGLEFTRYKQDFTDIAPATDPNWDYPNKIFNNKVMFSVDRKF